MITSILLDATHFGTPEPTGVELYTDELLPRLSRLLQQKNVKVNWIGHTETPPNGMPDNVEWHFSPYEAFWSQRQLGKELQYILPDLFFTPSGLTPLRVSTPTALTIHDLAVYHFPKAFSTNQRLRLTTLSRAAAKRASVVITPSQYTKDEIVRQWKVSEEKVAVTHLAPFTIPIEPDDVPLTGSAPLLLFVGRIELKKNLIVLIEAFGKLEPGSARLVLAGSDGYGANRIHQTILKLPENIQQNIFFPGYITAAQKRYLHELATLAIVPGTVEGFGLPVLEAFMYKVPVLCSNSGSLPEVGGKAAFYAEPIDKASWVRQLQAILGDAKLREEHIKLGTERLSNFHWDKTASITASALTNSIPS